MRKHRTKSNTSVISKSVNYHKGSSSHSVCLGLMLMMNLTWAILLTIIIAPVVVCLESNDKNNIVNTNNSHNDEMKQMTNVPDKFTSRRKRIEKSQNKCSGLSHDNDTSHSIFGQGGKEFRRRFRMKQNGINDHTKCTCAYEKTDSHRKRTKRKSKRHGAAGDDDDKKEKQAIVKDEKQLYHHPIHKNPLLMNITDMDVSENIHVHVYTITGPNPINCGGCSILWQLYYNIREMGISTSNQFDHGSCGENIMEKQIESNKTIVYVYPEVYPYKCEGHGNRVHVRWILAPVGISVNETITNYWGKNDLVFNYGPTDKSIPLTNILQVLQNPIVGDETDIPPEVITNQKGRDGAMWMLRKAKPYEHMMDLTMVDKFDDVRVKHKEKPNVTDFLEYEYFLSYDPYTFYSYIAAMVGTVSIVVPMPGLSSRKEWELSTFMGAYIKLFGGNIPGVAYGLDQNEIDYARRTMSQTREFLFKVKTWGESTIPLALRDCLRFGRGERNHFEGAMLVDEVYSKDKMVDNFFTNFAATHEHDGFGPDAHEDYGKGIEEKKM